MIYFFNTLKEIIFLSLFKILCSRKEDKVISPFFILSPGRSGSTYLRKEIISYTNANIPPESGDIIPQSMKTYVKLFFSSWEKKVDEVLKVFRESDDFKYWAIDIMKVRSKLLKSRTRTLKIIIKAIYDEYAKKYHFNKNFWGDKTPYLSERVVWIKTLFPNSKLIFIDRNTDEIIKSRMENFQETYEQASRRINFARNSIEKSLHKGEDIYKVYLNDLIIDKEVSLRKIIAFLDGVVLKEKRTGFYLGDDILIHHSKLHNY